MQLPGRGLPAVHIGGGTGDRADSGYPCQRRRLEFLEILEALEALELAKNGPGKTRNARRRPRDGPESREGAFRDIYPWMAKRAGNGRFSQSAVQRAILDNS